MFSRNLIAWKIFMKKKHFFSPTWRIQERFIEFSQHHYRLLSRFQWAWGRSIDFHIFSNSDWSKIYVVKKWISHGSRVSNKSQSNFLSISIDSSLDSNEQELTKWAFIFSRILIGRKIFKRKNRFVTRFEYTTKVNRIFSASVSTPLSIPMSKRSRNRLSYFLEF